MKGDKIKLTAEQKREWQKLSGKYYSDHFNKRIDGKSNDEARAKALKKLVDDAYEYAKKELF